MLQFLKANDTEQRADTHKFCLPELSSFTNAKPAQSSLWRRKQALQCAEVAPRAAQDPADCEAKT